WGTFIVGKCIDLGRILWKCLKAQRKDKEQEIKNRKVNSISIVDVRDDYKQNGNKAKYRGYKIRWHVEFFKLESSLIYSQMYLKSNKIIVYTKVTVENYPELKNEKKGEKYIITGIVDKMEKDTVYLEKLIELKKETFFVI